MNNKLSYLKKIIYSNFVRLKYPHKISYILTYQCNLRCSMCNIWKKKPTEELNLEEIERFFKISNNFSWVGITGGEPFLRKDINEVVKIIIDNCKQLVAIHFASNGTMTDRIIEVVEETLSYKKRKCKLLFTLSIDGPPYLHDKIRGLDGGWVRCMNTFRKLRQNKFVKPRIGITLSHSNLNAFPELFASLKDAEPSLKFDDITINIFQKSSFYYSNDAMPSLDYSQITKAIDKILSMDNDSFTINNFLRRKYLVLYKRYLQYKRCPLRCQALSATCIMDPAGEIYPCGIYDVKIANIKEYDYDLNKIWNRSAVQNLSAQCSKSICPSCWSPCDAYSAIGGSLFKWSLWRK